MKIDLSSLELAHLKGIVSIQVRDLLVKAHDEEQEVEKRSEAYQMAETFISILNKLMNVTKT